MSDATQSKRRNIAHRNYVVYSFRSVSRVEEIFNHVNDINVPGAL